VESWHPDHSWSPPITREKAAEPLDAAVAGAPTARESEIQSVVVPAAATVVASDEVVDDANVPTQAPAGAAAAPEHGLPALTGKTVTVMFWENVVADAGPTSEPAVSARATVPELVTTTLLREMEPGYSAVKAAGVEIDRLAVPAVSVAVDDGVGLTITAEVERNAA
jgi:hypothetical protein